jgi:hypothetical protein
MEHSALPIFAKDGLHETSIVPKHNENITNKANQKYGKNKIKKEEKA